MLRRAVKASDRLAPGQLRGSSHVQHGRSNASLPAASLPAAITDIRHTHAAAAAPPPKHQPSQQQPQSKHRALAAFSEIVRKAGAGGPAANPSAPAAAVVGGIAGEATVAPPAAATPAARLPLPTNKPAGATTAAAALQHAHAAAAALLQQVQQEWFTYLYEYACQVRALVASLQQCAAAGTSSHGQWPLQLLQLCCTSWEACAALMEQQADNPGQDITQELQPVHAATQALLEQALQHGSLQEVAALAGDEQLQEYCNAVVGLVQMGKAWLLVTSEPTSGATWCFQVLRQQLPRLSQLSTQAQDPDLLQQLQLMQFHTLHGSLLLASQQGHKVLWSNLMAQLQQLLSYAASGPGCSATMGLVLAGTLVQETERLTAGCTPLDRVLLLDCAVELLAHSYVQVEQMEEGSADEQPRDQQLLEVRAVKEQLLNILQQALLSLAEAHLDSADPPKALATCQQVQALPAPPLAAAAAGLHSLQAHAYLQLGRLDESVQHFCCWLGCRAEEQGPSAGSKAAGYLQQLLNRGDDITPHLEKLLPAVAEAAEQRPSLAQQVIAQLLASVGLSSSLLEGNLVALLGRQSVINIILQSPQLKAQCHQVLYEQGLHHHSIGQYARAAIVLKPANFFSPPHLLSKTAKLQAACLLHLQQPGAAASYLHMAGEQTGERTMAQVLLQLQAQVAEPAASSNMVQDLVSALSSCSDFDMRVYKAVAELCLEHQQPGAAWQALAAWHAAAAAAGRLAHLPTILQLLLAAHTRLAADKSTAAAAERLTLLATVLHGCMPLWTEEQVDQQGKGDTHQLHDLSTSSLRLGLQALQLGATPTALEAIQALAHFTGLQAAAAGTASTSSSGTWQQAHLVSLKAALLALLRLHDSNTANAAPLQLARTLLQAAKDYTAGTGSAGSSFEVAWLAIECAIACQSSEAADFKTAIKQLAAHPDVTAADMQALAATCLQKRPWHSPLHAALAYGHMLRIATDSTQPDAASAVAAAQGLLLCSPSPLLHAHACQRVLAALELCQLPSCASPTDQTLLEGLQWLVTKCWNGAVQLREADPQGAVGYWRSAAGLLGWLHSSAGPSGQQYALQLQGSAAYKVLEKRMVSVQQQAAGATPSPAVAPDVVPAGDPSDGEAPGDTSADDAPGHMEAASGLQERAVSSASGGGVGCASASRAAESASLASRRGVPAIGLVAKHSVEPGVAPAAAFSTQPAVTSPSRAAAAAVSSCKQVASLAQQEPRPPSLVLGSQLDHEGVHQLCSKGSSISPGSAAGSAPAAPIQVDGSLSTHPSLEPLPATAPQAPVQAAAAAPAPAITVIPCSQPGDVCSSPVATPLLPSPGGLQQVQPGDAPAANPPGSQPAVSGSSSQAGREPAAASGTQDQVLDPAASCCAGAAASQQSGLGTAGPTQASQRQSRKRSHEQLLEAAGPARGPGPSSQKLLSSYPAAAAAGPQLGTQPSEGHVAKHARLELETPLLSPAAAHSTPHTGQVLEQLQGMDGNVRASGAAGSEMQDVDAAGNLASGQAASAMQDITASPADAPQAVVTELAPQQGALRVAPGQQDVLPSTPSQPLLPAQASDEVAAIAATPTAASVSASPCSAAVEGSAQLSPCAAIASGVDAATAALDKRANPGAREPPTSLASQPKSSSSQQEGGAEGQVLAQGSLVCSRDMDVDVLSLALTS